MDRIPEQVVNHALKLFGTMGAAQFVGGSYNNVFETHLDYRAVILKIIPSLIADLNTILSELEWVRCLSCYGLKVCLAIPSKREQFIETIVHGESSYYALCYEKSLGVIIDPEGPCWNQNLFRSWGATMGAMHAAATQFRPSDPRIRRPHWYEHPLFVDANSFPKSGGEIIRQKWIDAEKWLHSLATPHNAYGLIHNDLHHYNFHLKDQDLVLFDFGDCEYGWFSYDVAISVYHAVQTVSPHERMKFANEFLSAFLDGYLSHHTLDSEWIRLIPQFIEYRRLFSLAFFLRHVETFAVPDDTWQAIMKMKVEVEEDEPFIRW